MSQCVELIGTDPAMAAVRRQLEDAARSDEKVLITGESGVGKEVVSRLIHERGVRDRRWSPSTAPESRTRCWNPSCSATSAAASRTRTAISVVCAKRHMAARCSSTKLAR
jgi:hypothetical protein